MCVCSVVSDSLWPQGLEEPGSSIPQDFPGKKTGVGSHFQLMIKILFCIFIIITTTAITAVKSPSPETPLLLAYEHPHQLLNLQGPSETCQFAPPVFWERVLPLPNSPWLLRSHAWPSASFLGSSPSTPTPQGGRLSWCPSGGQLRAHRGLDSGALGKMLDLREPGLGCLVPQHEGLTTVSVRQTRCGEVPHGEARGTGA